MPRSLSLLLAIPLVAWCAFSAPARAEAAATFTDVGQLAREAHAEVGVLLLEMGRAPAPRLDVDVSDVAPHEVLSLARTFRRKVDDLVFEQLRRRVEAPDVVVAGAATAGDVARELRTSLARLREVKAELGIEEETVVPAGGAGDASDAFATLLGANRHLNQLLERGWRPREVFREVTLAVSLASEVLGRFPGATRLPSAPPFERKKRPADVYMRLMGCFDLVREALTAAGVKVMKLDAKGVNPSLVQPSDVFDVASVIVAELRFLRARFTDKPLRYMPYAAGRKLPSHVYQRAGLLERQLEELVRRARARPERLASER